MAAKEESSEYKALRKSYEALVGTLVSNLEALSDTLFSEGLISRDVKLYVNDKHQEQPDKARRLLDHLMNRIEANPTLFQQFLDILDKDGSWGEEIADVIRKNFEQKNADENLAMTGAKKQSSCSKFTCSVCGKCSLRQFFSPGNKCYKKIQADEKERDHLFPYLDLSNLSRAEKETLQMRLFDDTQEMINLFSDTEDDIITSFESLSIDVEHLKNFAGNQAARSKGKTDVTALLNATTIAGVFVSLHPFKSFFNYEIIDRIVRKFGSPQDIEKMDMYMSRFKKFCERGVFEVPPQIFHDCEPEPGDKVFSLIIQNDIVASLENVVAFRRKLADILKIDPLSLRLWSIEKSSVCLRFLIAKCVADKLFPLSKSQIIAVHDIGAEFSVGNVDDSVNKAIKSGGSFTHQDIKKHTENISKETIETVMNCLMHNRNCLIPNCPCYVVRRLYHKNISAKPTGRPTSLFNKQQSSTTSSSGSETNSDKRSKLFLPLSSQDDGNFHPHYHPGTRARSKSIYLKTHLARRRSKSLDLTPVDIREDVSSPVVGGTLFPETPVCAPKTFERHLDNPDEDLTKPEFKNGELSPADKKLSTFKALSRQNSQQLPVFSRIDSMSADDIPILCLNDCPFTSKPARQVSVAGKPTLPTVAESQQVSPAVGIAPSVSSSVLSQPIHKITSQHSTEAKLSETSFSSLKPAKRSLSGSNNSLRSASPAYQTVVSVSDNGSTIHMTEC